MLTAVQDQAGHTTFLAWTVCREKRTVARRMLGIVRRMLGMSPIVDWTHTDLINGKGRYLITRRGRVEIAVDLSLKWIAYAVAHESVHAWQHENGTLNRPRKALEFEAQQLGAQCLTAYEKLYGELDD